MDTDTDTAGAAAKKNGAAGAGVETPGLRRVLASLPEATADWREQITVLS